jgi:hypothetical protein
MNKYVNLFLKLVLKRTIALKEKLQFNSKPFDLKKFQFVAGLVI